MTLIKPDYRERYLRLVCIGQRGIWSLLINVSNIDTQIILKLYQVINCVFDTILASG